MLADANGPIVTEKVLETATPAPTIVEEQIINEAEKAVKPVFAWFGIEWYWWVLAILVILLALYLLKRKK